MPPSKPASTQVSQELMKPHPERLYLLSGAWLAMMSLGVIGMNALINPEVQLPLIDPLLRTFSTESTTPDSVYPDKTYIESVKPPIEIEAPLADSEPATEVAPTMVVETTNPTPTPTPAPDPSPSSTVPIWVYLAIIISSASGSLLITYVLYKSALGQPSASPKKKKVKRPAKKKRLSPNRSSSLSQKSSERMVAQQPISVKPMVPAIAPLHISTPKDIEPPTVQLDTVVDPQPVAPTPSKASRLANIAKNAKPQPPRSLVDRVDIRQRVRIASFL